MSRKRAQQSEKDLRSLQVKGAAKQIQNSQVNTRSSSQNTNPKRKLATSTVLSAEQENDLVGNIHRLTEVRKILMKSVFYYAATNNISNSFSKVPNKAVENGSSYSC